MKWVITEQPSFSDGCGGAVRVFRVRETTWEEWRGIDVWWSRNEARCCACSGKLSAMLTTCKHAQALKRKMKRAGA